MSAHRLRARPRRTTIGFGRYIVSATTPFAPRRPGRAAHGRARRRRAPRPGVRGASTTDSAGACSTRSSASTSTPRPAATSAGQPRYDFAYALERLAAGEEWRSRARPRRRRQGLPRRVDRRLHRALNPSDGARAHRVVTSSARAQASMRFRRALLLALARAAVLAAGVGVVQLLRFAAPFLVLIVLFSAGHFPGERAILGRDESTPTRRRPPPRRWQAGVERALPSQLERTSHRLRGPPVPAAR